MTKSTVEQTQTTVNSSVERALNFASLVEICDILLRTDSTTEQYAAFSAAFEDLCDMFLQWAVQPHVLTAIKKVAEHLTPPND